MVGQTIYGIKVRGQRKEDSRSREVPRSYPLSVLSPVILPGQSSPTLRKYEAATWDDTDGNVKSVQPKCTLALPSSPVSSF